MRRNPTRYRKSREMFKEMLPGLPRDKNAIIRYLNEFDIEWADINVRISPVWLISYLRDAVTDEMLRQGITPKPSDTMTKRALDACAAIKWEDVAQNDIDQTYPASVGVELSLALLGSPMAIEMLWKDYPILYKAIRDRKKRKPRENPTVYDKARAMLKERLYGFSDNDTRALFRVLKELDIEYDDLARARGKGPDETITFDDAARHITHLLGVTRRGRDAYTVKAEKFADRYALDDNTMYSAHSGVILSMALAGSEQAQRDVLMFGKKKVADAMRVYLKLPRENPTRYQRSASEFKSRLVGFEPSDVRALLSVLREFDIEFDSIAEPDDRLTFPQAIEAIRSAIEIQIGRHPVATDAITDRAGRFLDAFDRVVVKAFSVDEGILLSLAAAGSFIAQETILSSGSRVGEKFIKRVRSKARK